MMPNLHFTFAIKPISINSAYYKSKVFTREARMYRDAVFATLLQHSAEIKAFTAKYRPLIDNASHMLHITIVHKIPVKDFYTLKGTINQKTGDTENFTKLLIDFMLLERYMEQKFLCSMGEVVNIGIDDCYVQRVTATKVAAAVSRWTMEVTVECLPIIKAE